MKNIEIMFDSGQNEQIRKNAHNTLTVTKCKNNESIDRNKGNKTLGQNEKKTKW